MDQKLEDIQKRLAAKSDPSNIEFFGKMVPGKQRIYGVKTPDLNLLAKEFKVGGFQLAEALWKSGALEEKVIAIKILEQIGKKDAERTLKLIKVFAKKIDNWAVCDGLGMQALKGVRPTHTEEIFALAKKYNQSARPLAKAPIPGNGGMVHPRTFTASEDQNVDEVS